MSIFDGISKKDPPGEESVQPVSGAPKPFVGQNEEETPRSTLDIMDDWGMSEKRAASQAEDTSWGFDDNETKSAKEAEQKDSAHEVPAPSEVNPPAVEPPVAESLADDPAADEPPMDEPPVVEPPVVESPGEEPADDAGSSGGKKRAKDGRLIHSIVVKKVEGDTAWGEAVLEQKKKDLVIRQLPDDEASALVENMELAIAIGSVNDTFLWPEAVCVEPGRAGEAKQVVGVVRAKLSGDGAPEALSTNLCGGGGVRQGTLDMCLRLTYALEQLNNRGGFYANLSDANVAIDWDRDEIKILQPENISFKKAFAVPSAFSAPEVLLGQTGLGKETQAHELATMLFLILMGSHPLEGKRWVEAPVHTAALKKQMYATDPLFVFDPNDASNEPSCNVQNKTIVRWHSLPDYVQTMFLRAFGKEGLGDPSKRPSAQEWLELLIRWRSCLVKCQCGAEIYVEYGKTLTCRKCGKVTVANRSIQFASYQIPIVRGTRLYGAQFNPALPAVALSVVFQAVAKPQDETTIGLKKVMDVAVNAYTPSGKQRVVENQEVVPYKAGIILEAFDGKAELK